MSADWRVLLKFSVSMAVVGAMSSPAAAQRLPRAAAVLVEQANAAETRFKAAQDKDQQDAAIVQMEKAMADCGRTRGCPVEKLMPIYRRMLQPAPAPGEIDDEGDEDENPINIVGGVPAAATADALLDERNKRFVQAVQFNPAVQAGIRRWLTDMRPALMESYTNYQYLRPQMAPAFQRAGLPEALLFGIMAKESNGKVHVGSRAGAIGPLQFMPATGRRFGLGNDGTGFDTRYDPQMSAEAAAAYLMERYAQLDSSIEMSLAAYNGGEGRALRVYRASGGRNFWDANVYNQFPAETKDYVPMVIAAAWLFLHPDEYGLRFPRAWGAGRPAQIQLKRATSINELGICLGNARGTNGYLRHLRNLNPRYTPSTWLAQGTTLNVSTTIATLYSRYCVSGKRAEIARQLIDSDVSQALVQVGPLVTGEGANADAGASVGEAVPASPVTPPTPAAAPAPTPAPAKPAAAPAKPAPAKTHRVGSGETLTSIARQYQCDLRRLAEANGIDAPRYVIRPGQTITLTACQR